MIITNNGNVGIGISVPFNPFHVSANIQVILKVESSTGGLGNRAAIDFSSYQSTTGGNFGNARIAVEDMGGWNGSLIFYTDGNGNLDNNQIEIMRINEKGNVGISTASPEAKFHINGN
jgi:hypothetical protein